MQLTPEEAEASDEQLRRAVLTLWQTNLLRRTKLTVLDEVANGLSFYDYTFLREVPRLHCALEDRLNQEDGGAPGELASFLTHGKLDRRRPRRQSVRHRRRDARHAAAAVEPGDELLSRGAARARLANCRWRRISPTSPTSCARWPSARPTPRRIASGEPYRLAVSGIYARLTATALRAATSRPRAGRSARPRPMPSVDGVQGRSRRARPLADRE